MDDNDQVAAIQRWLLEEAVTQELTTILEGLALRLVAVGLPLNRFSLSFSLLNPSILAANVVWRPDEPVQFGRYDYARRDSGMYEASPFKVAHEEKRWVEVALNEVPDDIFGIVPDLKEEGLAHYCVIPLPDAGGAMMSTTMATKAPEGFSESNRKVMAELLPAIRAVLEIKTLRATFRDVLGAYVGARPAQEIMQGTVHRGQVTEVRAAILVADLRGFTYLSTQMPPQSTADVINAYYDVVVPPIQEHGGEVLKFIGDAVLAIFRTEAMGDEKAALEALAAARQALDAVPPPLYVDGQMIPIRFGVAIHLGDAVIGNVGSGDRLDFTVIGRDVNIAARIASLCSRLGRDYLVSQAVADVGVAQGRTMTDAGAHEVRGLRRPLRVFVPDVTSLPPELDDGVSQGLVLTP